MSLIDPDRFEGANRIKKAVDVSDVMRRLVKEDLLTFEGKPLFPERRAHTVSYKLSASEMKLYDLVTDYVSDGFNRAERLSGNKKNSVGFAMTVLQRRLASSPCAIYKSLARRTERLKKLFRDKNLSDEFVDADFDDEFPSGEFETKEDELTERMTAARNLVELRNEIQTLERLTEMAKNVFRSGKDRKWRELSELLQGNEHLAAHDKLIIFTEHRDTLDYLHEKISALFGRSESVATIHGGMTYRERRKIQEQFKDDKNIFVLVATDAAGEGINLQCAHLMINYDLPWNPNRLEQRFGRIHRIGQKKICHLWNLVAGDTREGQVFQRLLKKLEVERSALGGKVFDILGKISFDNRPLRELLIEAVRYGDNPTVIRQLDSVVDKSFDANKLQELMRQRALTEDTLEVEKVADISRNMERVGVRKLQPHCIENFFLTAFKRLGGQFYRRGNGCYEIPYVPGEIRKLGAAEKSYKRICFEKNSSDAELIAHGLLSAVCAATLKRYGELLRHGTIFVDDSDAAQDLRLLFYVEIEIVDGRAQTLSRQVRFVEILQDGRAVPTSSAPYMDYRAPTDDERNKILAAIRNAPWLAGNVEKCAVEYAEKNFVAPQRQQLADKRKLYLDRLEAAVKSRLRSEIGYLDNQAYELRNKDKAKSTSATRHADELAERLNRRLEEIASERKISAATPVVIGGALIVPNGRLKTLNEKISAPDALSRAEIETIAMNAVINIERELGNQPADVSGDKCGYDIESREPTDRLRFIEVKGRNADADTVTVTKNEILTALNAPDNFILAIVAVAGNSAQVTYLQNPFKRPPDFSVVSITYQLSALIKQGKIILTRNLLLGGG